MLHRLQVMVRILMVLGVSLATIGCVSDKNVIAQAADAHKNLEPAVLKDPQLADYVQKVGDRVVRSARELAQEGFKKDRIFDEDPQWMFEDVTFHLVNSETLNAFTTGGTHVYLYSELFRTAKTEDEFAAVVAHEFSHIAARHVHKGMTRQYTLLGAAAAAAIGGYALGGDNAGEWAAAAGGATLIGGQFVSMGFGRKDENEADDWGFKFYARAGWDPDRFGDFFQTMVDKGYDTTPEYASSHPTLKSRVEKAHERAEKWKRDNPDWERLIQPDVVTPNQFRKLQERALAVGKNVPNDTSLQAARLLFDAFPSCVAPTDQKRQVQAREELGEILQKQQQQQQQQKRK